MQVSMVTGCEGLGRMRSSEKVHRWQLGALTVQGYMKVMRESLQCLLYQIRRSLRVQYLSTQWLTIECPSGGGGVMTGLPCFVKYLGNSDLGKHLSSIFGGTTYCGTTFLHTYIYIENEMYTHIVTKFWKEILIRKLLIKASK